MLTKKEKIESLMILAMCLSFISYGFFKSDEHPLISILKENDKKNLPEIIEMIDRIDHLDFATQKVPSVMHLAAKHPEGHKIIAKLLDRNETRDLDFSLYVASSWGSVETVKLLLQAGADINYTTPYGITPLLSACVFGQSFEMIKTIIEAGADIDIDWEDRPNSMNLSSPLWLGSIHLEDARAIDLLLNSTPGLNHEVLDFILISALEHNKNSNVARVILKHGANPNHNIKKIQKELSLNSKDIYWLIGFHGTPIFCAANAEFGSKAKVEALLEYGAMADYKNYNGDTVFTQICYACKNSEVIKILLKAGANVNARNEQGLTPLMAAASSNEKIAIIKQLLAGGAYVNTRDYEGETALMKAAKSNQNPGVVRFLLESGANPFEKCLNGHNMFDKLSQNKAMKDADFSDYRTAAVNQL